MFSNAGVSVLNRWHDEICISFKSLLTRSGNGLVFTSRSCTALVKSYGLQQEFIIPYSSVQNGMVERVICTLVNAQRPVRALLPL